MVDKLAASELNTKRIANVEQCFGSSGKALLQPHRVLVGEGVLIKMCRKKPKPRQFFLFNDILVYGNIIINKKKYNKQHIIGLESLTVKPVDDDGELRNGWQVISPQKSFVVYAATDTEKDEWITHINKCRDDLLRKSGKRPSAAQDNSPVWVPDSQSPRCMHCHAAEFTLLNRRHHCRKCGLVVCNDCSTQRWMLPQQSDKPQRVCDGCYKTLKNDTKRLTVTMPGSSANAPTPSKYGGGTSEGDSSEEEDNSVIPSAEHPTFYQ